jgi:hypothetical protein
MRIFWNTGQRDIIKGLDVLGLRQIDQEVEKSWVSRITTISIRARYLSLLPWILAEFFHRELGPDGQSAVYDAEAEVRLAIVLARLEFVVALSSAQGGRWGESGITTGVRGNDYFSTQLTIFDVSGKVHLPDEERSGIYGTYVNPCQGFGLITFGSAIPQITPRGKEIVLARRRAMGEHSPILEKIFGGGSVTTAELDSEGRHFSVNGLDASGEERTLLVQAMLEPYDDAAATLAAYARFGETIRWAGRLSGEMAGTSASLIGRAYQYAVNNPSTRLDGAEKAWAEYDLRRRVHFSLELLFEVLTSALPEHTNPTIARIIAAISQDTDLAPSLRDSLGMGSFDWTMSVGTLRQRLGTSAFGQLSLNVRQVQPLTSANRCVHAICLLIACAEQSAPRRSAGDFPDRQSYMERVFALIDTCSDQQVTDLIQQILRHAVIEPHLSATLRKMAGGQRCSLRFYPEGQYLRATGMGAFAGHSNDRLGNVLGMLADLGLFLRNGGEFSPAAETMQKLGVTERM